MDVHAARGGERMLRRVIALLAAFAVLAERAAVRSMPVRWFVLWLMRRAESAAGEYVFEQTGMPPPVREGFAADGDDPEEALRLAARFRALAAALCVLLPLARRLHYQPSRHVFAFGHMAPGSGRGLSGWTREPYDTS